MTAKKRVVIISSVAVAIVLWVVLALTANQAEFVNSPWSLLPPIIAIVLALITKEVYSSLFIGIATGALLISGFQPVKTIDVIIEDGIIKGVADAWNVGIFLFLIMLGIIVALINQAGGSAAFGNWANKNIKSRIGVLIATFVLGILIFIDDYFNCLTVGSVMRPITDRKRISRAKLAYIIDATAAPICMIAPISSWAAAVSGMVKGQSGISLFIKAIPYNFYSLMTFVFVVGLILLKFDYGPMKRFEQNAIKNGDLFTTKRREDDVDVGEYSDKGKIIDLIIPIVLLIVCCVIGMIYVGGFFEGKSFIDAFADTDASIGLPWGTLIALLITMLYLILRGTVSFKSAMGCIVKGFNAMVPALLILTFAVTLKNITASLGAAEFVANVVNTYASSFANFLPAVIFIVAVFLAFSTGTSWGTFGILIPIVTAVFANNNQLMVIGISACLAGAVCGDHCSPISDTTIMSSAGAQCNHVDHVSTQLPYSLTVAGISFIGYIIAGIIPNPFICLGICSAITIAILFVFKVTIGKAKD